MRFITFTTALAAAIVSAVAMVPFLPAAKLRPDHFVLEAKLTSKADGILRVYYDDGGGLREDLSGSTTIHGASVPALYRVPFPPGRYRSLRFDPIESEGTVWLHAARVTTQAGRTLREFPLDEFKPVNQIESLRAGEDGLEIITAKGSNDPQLSLVFKTPLHVEPHWSDYARSAAPIFVSIFLGLTIVLVALDRAPRLRTQFVGIALWGANNPLRAVCAVAALSVAVSMYPVIFLGKSLVSPNLGTILLYDNYPTLPGYKSGEVTDVKLADVGAIMWQHVPFSMIQHRALAQGELPLWNRYNAAGVPLLAQGQSMFGDPLHFFVIAANGAAWAWDIKFVVAKWLFATGLALSVFSLLRSHRPPSGSGLDTRQPLVAALIVALAAPFIGFFLYRVNHPAYFSLCYAPWPLYCLIRIANAKTRRDLAFSAAALVLANIALMNSGTVKEAYMLLVTLNFSGVCVILATATSWREAFFKGGTAAWAGLIFALLTVPIWASFLHTLKHAYTGYNVATAYQIQPTLLLGLFDEIFYRPLMQHDRVFSPSLNFLLLLGVLYFLATLRLHFRARGVAALAASSLLPLSLAFGLVPPQWIITLPFLSNIAHLDNTFSCVLIVLWSVLAGIGFGTALQRLATPEGRGDLIIVALLLLGLVSGWIAFRQAAHRPIFGPTFSVHAPGQTLAINPVIWDYLAALLIAAGVLIMAVRGMLLRRTCSPARGLMIAIAVATLLWRHGLHASTVGFEAFTSQPTERVNFHARSGAMEFARAAHAREPGRGFGFNGHFFPGWTGVYGLETVHGPDALVNPFLRQLVDVSGVERIWDWRLYAQAADVAKVQPFFDALNVRFYFDLKTGEPALARSLRLVHSADLDVYESPSAWPRAFFTNHTDSYDQPAQLIEKLRSAGGKPMAAFQQSDSVATAELARVPREASSRRVTPATNYRLTENSTSFYIRADSPGVVVLTEAFWPGDFRAEVNGRERPVLRLNHAFKGVAIDAPGDFTIRFRYWPQHFLRYLLLSAMGVVLLAGSLWLALRPPAR